MTTLHDTEGNCRGFTDVVDYRLGVIHSKRILPAQGWVGDFVLLTFWEGSSKVIQRFWIN